MALTKVKNSNIDDAVLDAYDTSSEVDVKVASIVDSAPGTLNTLNELAAALGDDENHASAMTTLINDKLSPDGDGSQLVNLPASGGVVEAVASGALANGDKVILKTDGTVEVISAVTTPSLVAGDTETYQTAYTDSMSMAFDPNDTNTFIVTSRHGGGSPGDYGKAQVGTIDPSTKTISFGSPYVFSSVATYETTISFDPNTSGTFVITYKYSDKGRAIVGVRTGATGITWGTYLEYDSNYPTKSHMACDPNKAGSFVVAFRAGYQGNKLYVKACTFTGTTITAGNANWAHTNASTYANVVFDPNTAGKVVISSFDETAYNGYVSVWEVNQTTPTQFVSSSPARVVFNSGETIYPVSTFCSANKVVTAFNSGGPGAGKVVISTLSGTTITPASAITFNSTNITNFSIGSPYLTSSMNTSDTFVVAWRDDPDGYAGKMIKGVLSGSNITFSSEVEFDVKVDNPSPLDFDPGDATSFVVVHNFNTASTKDGAASLCGTTVTTSNLEANNYIGISDGAYADTTTATIQVVGATDDAQSGLTTGSKYYVRDDGTLSTTTGSPSVYGGMALSPTKLLIKG